jgi:hypothetical protein
MARTIKSLNKSGRVSRSRARAAVKEIRLNALKARKSTKSAKAGTRQLADGKYNVVKFRAEKWLHDPGATIVVPKKSAPDSGRKSPA